MPRWSIGGSGTRSPGRYVGATIALLAVQALLVFGSAFMLAMFAMGSDACTGKLFCDRPTVGPGIAVGVGGGIALFVVSLVTSVVLMVKRLRSVWVPLVGCGVQLVLFGVGVLLVVQPAAS